VLAIDIAGGSMHIPTLHTQRLTIRPFSAADWQAVYAYTSNPLVMAYMPSGTLTQVQAQEFVERHSSDQAEAAAVVLTATQHLIGHIIFHPWFAPRTYEIGWAFNPGWHRQGYATEAAHALLTYGLTTLQLHRIIATCQPENIASFRVMEKLGMRREGHFQQCIDRGNGVWWDELFYAILHEEWVEPPQRGV
jgi:RimJ/RimL family protein N-acetyltransferase